jgi:hypothetical protein
VTENTKQEIDVSDSTNIAEATYYEQTETLEITFANKSMYHYHNVPPDVVEEFVNAPSKGSFLHHTIKQYPCTKLT